MTKNDPPLSAVTVENFASRMLNTAILYASTIPNVLAATARTLTQDPAFRVGFAWCDTRVLEAGNDVCGVFSGNATVMSWEDTPHIFPTKPPAQLITLHQDDFAAYPSQLTDQLLSLACDKATVYPIFWEDKLVGGLGVAGYDEDVYPSSVGNTLADYAQQSALGIMNAISQEVLEEQISWLEQTTAKRMNEIERSHQRIESILNNSLAPIIFVSAEGEIEQANRAFHTMMGAEDVSLIGESFWDFMSDTESALIYDQVADIDDEGAPFQFEVELHAADKHLTARMLLTVAVENNEWVGCLCSFQDISDSLQREHELQDKLTHAHELNHMRSQFVSMASHQFRTPLAIIMAASQSFVDYYDKMKAEQREQRLSRIQQQIKHMTNLLDNVLILSNLESHQEVLEPTAIHLNQWVKRYLRLYEETPDYGRILYHADDALDTEIWTDDRLLRRIFDQMVSNALKFSPIDATIDVHLTSQGQDILLSVVDHGIGIPEEELPRIFESFYRGTNAIAMPGTGLGLAILQEDVRLLGGTVQVTSQLHEGTTITVAFTKSSAITGMLGSEM